MEDTKPIAPLLEWLAKLDLISEEERDGFQNKPPKHFFGALRCGYILSKIACIAVPSKATSWRSEINVNAKTRYKKTNIHEN